jgi:hypothetical protein
MKITLAPVGALSLALILTACAGGSDEPTVDRADSSNEAPGAETAPPAEDAGEAAEIVKTGFGQKDDYVFVTSLVKNNTDDAGATVTVQYNVKDAAGKILVSDSQVESFSRGGQLLAVGTQLDVPAGTKAAAVEANLVVEPDGIGEEFPEVQVGEVIVSTDEFGEPKATFELTNPTNEPAPSLRVGVICLDAAGKIIGGTSEFPDLPPGGTARVDTLSLIVSGTPAKCDVYPGGL